MIRKAKFAGSWYPSEPKALAALIEQSLQHAKTSGSCRFAVLPHAGLLYSARGIAHFFAADHSKVERIVVLAPSHYTYLGADTLASTPLTLIETPFGSLGSTDFAWAKQEYFTPIQSEHALEMVLPFVAVLPNRPKVSLALVSHFSSKMAVEKAADLLIAEVGFDSLRNGETELIASSDFTHYGPRFGYTPYHREADVHVKEDDLALSQLLCEGRVEEAISFSETKRSTVCGIAAALLVSAIAARFDSLGWVADYYNSLQVTGFSDSDFVAYATILWR